MVQSSFIGKMVDFVHRYDVHVHIPIVTHPNKYKGGNIKENISGNGDISNRADNVFVI